MSRRARRREREAAAPPPPPRPDKRVSRADVKNAEARANLEPLAEGERPPAVTVAAVVAVLLVVIEVVLAVVGYDSDTNGVKWPGVVLFTGLLLAMAWGLWHARYWAVLGMQALLALGMLVFGLLLPLAGNIPTALLALAFIIPMGTLFWYLVKAMARIQMPDRPER